MSPQINPSIPVAGQPNASEEPKVVTALSALVGAVNAVDADQLQGALVNALGVNSAATTRRGFAQVTTSETTTSTALVDLATPGPSVSLTVPANGLVIAAAQADIANSTNGVANSLATLVVDGVAAAAPIPGGTLSAIASYTQTALGVTVASAFVSAGVHTFKLQYKVSSASTGTFANRKLWVAAFSFS